MKLARRKKSSHKGQNGIVLVIGGSEDYIGAPAFVGMSALASMRSGADLVYVAAPAKVAWAINCISPDVITRKFSGKYLTRKHKAKLMQLAKKADVVTIGNGMGLQPGTQQLITSLVKSVNKPLVIDADALRVVRLQDCTHAVLCPHGGEYKTLLKNSKLTGKPIKAIQKKLGNNVLVLKGHPKTTIVSKTKLVYNTTGNAGMTHGGTGDVLAGIIAALIAQGNDLFTSARVATYVNGKAADILYKKKGFGYLASDVVPVIPTVLKQFQK